MILTTPDLPQPNFQLISAEIAKIANIPAIQHGNAILEELRRMNAFIERIESRLDRMEAGIDKVEARLDKTEATIIATDANALARINNSAITSLYAKLSPLTTHDNQAVQSFPINMGALKPLSSGATSKLLQAYGLSDQGTLREKKRRFTSFIGLENEVWFYWYD